MTNCTENLNPKISKQENKRQLVFISQFSSLSWFQMSLLGSFLNVTSGMLASRITGSFSALASSRWASGMCPVQTVYVVRP